MKNLLVLDKEEYKSNNDKYIHLMDKYIGGKNSIIYTTYEDKNIRRVRNIKYIGSVLQHILYWKKSYCYARKILNKKYDNIYCINPIVGIFLGLYNKRSKIILSGFLFEPKKNKIYYKIRKVITKMSLKGINKVIVYGSKEVNYYKKIFPDTKFIFVKYGIDFNSPEKYLKSKLPEKYLFSGGGSNRDYKTVVEAFNKLNGKTDIKMVVATQSWRLKKLDTSEIIVLSDVVLETFGDVLKHAEMLVLSLKDVDISAGHMVMFQAMSLGIPIIVNDIPAIRDYVDENEVIFYNSKNVNQLKNIIFNFYEKGNKKDKLVINSKKKYNDELTFEKFICRILLV